MANNIRYIDSSGNTHKISNFQRVKIEKLLNDFYRLSMFIPGATDSQITNIKGDIELKITLGNHELFGYAKIVDFDSSSKGLIIEGNDYSIKLNDKYVETDHVSSEDATLSHGKTVVFDTVAFNTIASEILTYTGITAGTITNYGNISVRFENLKVGPGVMKLREIADYDWEVNTSKQLNMIARIGSASSVYSFTGDLNCEIVGRGFNSTSSKVYKVTVLGQGNGGTQLEGSATDGSYDGTDSTLNKERIFIKKGYTDTTTLNNIAAALLAELNTEFESFVVKAFNSNVNVQLGDEITVTSTKLTLSGLYRVTRLVKEIDGSSETLLLSCVASGSKLKKQEFMDILRDNQDVTEAIGIASQGSVSWKPFGSLVYNATSTNKMRLKFNIPSYIVNDSDVKGIKLVFTREDLIYDVDANTDNSATNAGITNAAAETNAGITNAATGTNAGVTNAETGTPGTGYSFPADGISYSDTGNTTFASWHEVPGINLGGYEYLFHWIAGFVRVYSTQPYEGFSVYVRAKNVTDTEYYPNTYGTIMGGAYSGYVRNSADTGSQQLIGIVPFFMMIPKNWKNKTLRLQVNVDGGSSGNREWDVLYRYGGVRGITPDTTFDEANHTNINTFDEAEHTNINTFDEADHANPMTRGVYAPGGEGALTINYDIDGSNRGNIASFAVGDNSTEIEIDTAWLAGSVVGEHYVDIYPTTSIARMNAVIYIKTFDDNI